MHNKRIKTGALVRGMQFKASNIDDDKRTAEVSFSSEEPYERWFGVEILGHGNNEVDLTRLNNGGAVFVDHYGDQIGVVEKAWVDTEEKKGRAVIRFSKSARGEEIFNDVKDGIRQNMSVGYVIDELVLVSDKNDTREYRATKWQPYEISIVGVPADITVGVGRNADQYKEHYSVITNLQEDKQMKGEVKKEVKQDVQEPKIDIAAERNKVREAELKRIAEITAIGEQFKMTEMAQECIKEGVSVDEFRVKVLEKMADVKPVQTSPEIGLGEKEKREYSFARLLYALSNPSDRKAQEAAAFEFECSREASKHYKKEVRGALIPFDVLTGERTMTAGTAAQGGNLIATDLLVSSFIELLRNKMVVRSLGATILSGLQGNLAIPKQSGGATAYWLAEDGTVTISDQSIAQVALTPKTVAGYTRFTRKLMLQSSLSIENFIRADLARTLALAIDLAAINGSGASNEPTGILNTSGIGAVEGGTDGAVPTWGNIVDLETEVAIDNADLGALAYLSNAKVRGKLKQTPKESGYPIYIWEKGQTPLNGYRALVSNQVPSNLDKGASIGVCSAILFGNWADLIIGEWSGLDVLVDPYSDSTQGSVKVVVMQDVDIAVRHAESFAAMQDALTT